MGIVAEEYVEGQMIDIEVELTAYHQVAKNNKKRQVANNNKKTPDGQKR